MKTRIAIVAVLALSVIATTPMLALAANQSGLVEAAPVIPQGNPVVGIDQKLGAQVPLDLVFRDESERPITLREAMQGKVTILVPVYFRCPMLCTRVLNGLVDGLSAMPNDFSVGGPFNIITVSMDPKEHADLGTAKKTAYLQAYGRPGAEEGWRFLTGKKEAVGALLDSVGYRYEFDKAFKEYNHPSGIIILTPEGKVSRYFLGIGYDDADDPTDPNIPRDPEGKRIAPPTWNTLKLSLVEASGGKIGSLADQLMLVCYRFDHLSQGFSLNVMRVVQAGGIITLLAVGTGLTIAFRRDRRKTATETALVPPDMNTTASNGKLEGTE